MVFDYLFVSNNDGARTIYESDCSVASISKQKVSTIGERWISLHRNLTFNSYEKWRKVLIESEKIGMFHEFGEMNFSEEHVEILNSATNCGMIAIPSDLVKAPEKSDVWQHQKNNTLLIVEIDSAMFIPLHYLKLGFVLDVWRHGSVLGFCAMVPQDTTIKIGGITNDRMYLCIDHKVAAIATASQIHSGKWDVQAEKQYRRMKCDGKLYPVAPVRCGCAPSTIVLCSRDTDDAVAVIEEALKHYPSLVGYGKEIKRYTGLLSSLQFNQAVKMSQWNTRDIHVIRIEDAAEYDGKEYLTRLRMLYSDEVSWRTRVPIRCITVLQGDASVLPMSFRKEFGIRYVNQVQNNGSVHAFITNKY